MKLHSRSEEEQARIIHEKATVIAAHSDGAICDIARAREIVATIIEECFEHLDSPVKRLSGLDVPTPYSPSLESAAIPQEEDIIKAVREMMNS